MSNTTKPQAAPAGQNTTGVIGNMLNMANARPKQTAAIHVPIPIPIVPRGSVAKGPKAKVTLEKNLNQTEKEAQGVAEKPKILSLDTFYNEQILSKKNELD